VRLGFDLYRRCLFLIAVLITICLLASGRFYQVTESDTGWTTGLRQSINATLDVSGSAVGKGTFYRYTDVKFDEVRARERVAASNGSLDTSEFIRLVATPIDPVEVTLVKLPDSRVFRLTVNETWPVFMASRRSIDYIGKGISDRDFLGNNLDYVGASHLYVTDLKEERASFLQLRNAWFEAWFDNSTENENDEAVTRLLLDRFMPAKITDYRLRSRFQGHAVLKYRQAAYDRTTANEGVEDYWGSFAIDRRVTMESSGRNASELEAIWLPCCSYGTNTSVQAADPEAYEEVATSE
jgi:hypothetical protein